MATTFDDLSKQRIDYSTGPQGETIATLTITLQDGSVHRFSASTDAEELESLGAAFATAELQQNKIAGIAMSDDEIAGLFGSIAKGFKKVARKAAKVATSKVFKQAAIGLAAAAPALGPLAPAALAVSGGMLATSQLAKAGLAAEAGAKRTARKLGLSAKRTAQRSNPRGWRTLMNVGNRKRKSAFRFANRSRGGWGRPRPQRRWAQRRTRVRLTPRMQMAVRNFRMAQRTGGYQRQRFLQAAARSGYNWNQIRRANAMV